MSDKIVQFSEAQKSKRQAIKREYERYLFDRFLGCYTVLEKRGLRSVEMVDISKGGCSFKMPTTEGAFHLGEEVDFRFYFSQKNFLPMRIQIQRVEKKEEKGMEYWFFGCKFDQEFRSYKTLLKFLDFIEAFSEDAREDNGDKQVYYF